VTSRREVDHDNQNAQVSIVLGEINVRSMPARSPAGHRLRREGTLRGCCYRKY
jgi:hypothetical protein